MKEVIGDLRHSQLVSSFGVGAMIDLPSLTGVVMGLDYWEAAKCPAISEPRLLRAVQNALGNDGIAEIRQTPPKPDQNWVPYPTDPNGIPVALFPRWLRCPLCSTLAPTTSGLFELRTEAFKPDRTRYIHDGCQKRHSMPDSRMPAAVPARFVVACENGHMEDFPWEDFIHEGIACASPRLRLYEGSASGDAADVFVFCEACERRRSMADAFGRESAFFRDRQCGGYHAHLHNRREGCTGHVKAMLIGASNSHFPLSISVLSLPATTNPLEPVVQRHWATLTEVSGKAEVALLRRINQLGDLQTFSDDQIWEGIERARAPVEGGETDAGEEIKRPEWRLFSGTTPVRTERLRTTITEPPPSYAAKFARVVLVEKFSEVRAMIGFTRLESAGDMSDLVRLPEERRVPLSRRRMTWVPGVEVRGEGIFIEFDEAAVGAWETSAPVRNRIRLLVTAHERWCSARPWMTSPTHPPTARFVLIHTFSHLLMRELGIRCGYGTASLRERVYCAEAGDATGPMAGVLIGTSSSDSEGTLGGLVALGKPDALGDMVRAALLRACICSSDPICACYDASSSQKLHGAVCHSCGFVPETSCECSNRFLDRSLVIETIETHGAAFFEQQRQ